ncbi:MAG TPA: peptide-methionine (R)-S-oxide reductase [Candidatus Poseidoniales archaeon]|nr:peptide-methionine (R)-S-oxide reductase [Candidatus Poseidoniales archaeon]
METLPPDPQVDGCVMIRAVMALSGGMDSTGLLLRLLADGYKVSCISYEYGQKHRIELERAKANIEYLEGEGHQIEHKIADLSSAMSLFHSALTSDDIEVPEGYYEEEQMKVTVVPNRNAIFASILYGYALSVSHREDCDVEIAMGVHSGDHAIYPDCRPEFYSAIAGAFALGNWGSDRVSFHLPYIDGDKETILRDALESCSVLNLDFETIFENTISSYNPDSEGRASGTSGADIERILAFHALGREDPIEYTKPWKDVLQGALNTQLRFHVMKQNGTEQAFSGEFDKHFEDGVYRCADCSKQLFESDMKYDSGCGWPSFNREISDAKIRRIEDHSHGMIRVELRCSKCDSHLGHVFSESKGERYCINSICLEFTGE